MAMREALLVCVSSLVFGFLDVLNRILRPIFGFLDSIFDSHPTNHKTPRGLAPDTEAALGPAPGPDPRWSDCSCSACTTWQLHENQLLHVHVALKDLDASSSCASGAGGTAHENVVFIHGFLSSSAIWSDNIIPHLPVPTISPYRLFAVDLLGFGRSPKPRHCLYTMADHIKAIEESVLQRHELRTIHLVAHSMGCIVALALAAAHPNSVKTITLVAPPYFMAPENELAASYALRQLAPRRIWPLVAFGVSVMSWYEHVGRGICFLVCKQHRVWELTLKALTFNRFPIFAIRELVQHTHHSAWHIFHNIICGEAHHLDTYLSVVEQQQHCEIHVFHGSEDTLIPMQCSVQLQQQHSKTKVHVLDGVNHFSILYGREKKFAHTLHNIWHAYSNRTHPSCA